MPRSLRLLAAPAALLALGCGCGGRTAAEALRGASVVVVMVDTLRADALGCYGYTVPTSPFLDDLVRRSVVFDDVTSTASQTVPAVISALSGVYPNQHGNQYFPAGPSFRIAVPGTLPKIPGDVPSLADAFRQRGYRTAAVVTNPWLRPQYGFGRGFDEYRNLWEIDQGALAKKPRGDAVNRHALEILDALGEGPFFLYLHYMDVHFPYEPPPAHREHLVGSKPGRVVYTSGRRPNADPRDVAFTRALYDAEVRGMDDHLRDLLAQIRARGDADSTLVVITSDHGDEFLEHGGLGHGTTLYQELVRVPLVLAHPALAGRRLSMPASLVDLMPTLLELTGEPMAPPCDGVSLAPWVLGERAGEAAPERTVFSELGTTVAARRGQHKLIRFEDLSLGAFDLLADPGESRPRLVGGNLDGGDPPWATALQAALFDHLAEQRAGGALPEPDPQDRLSTQDRRALEQLRMLGYVK